MAKARSPNRLRKGRKICSTCQQEKAITEFYTSSNPLHSDGFTPMCKECIFASCYDVDKDEIDINNLKSVLRQLDKPFIDKIWTAAVREYEKLTASGTKTVSRRNVIGNYFKNINTLYQIKALNWEQGIEYNLRNQAVENDGVSVESARRKSQYSDNVFYLSNKHFEVTEDMLKLFGEGYTAEEYEIMQNYYDILKKDYPNISGTQNELLLMHIRYRAKENIAAANGNSKDMETYSKLSNESMRQLNQSDFQGGVNSFSEFFQRFEREKDISRILPKFKYRPGDSADFIIWCYINYCRRLEGKPECSYEDVYHFYDRKVDEYVQQYGDPYRIFSEDTTLNNREQIEEFIKIPDDYKDENPSEKDEEVI